MPNGAVAHTEPRFSTARSGISPWPKKYVSSCCCIATVQEKRSTSIFWPSPVAARCTSAASTPIAMCSAVYWSAMPTPRAVGGSSLRPLRNISPLSAWISMSWPGRFS